MTDDVTMLLRDMRDQQQRLLEHSTQSLRHQAETLALQRQQFALSQQQFARMERVQERAEAIHKRASMASKLFMWVLAPMLGIVLLSLLLPWVRGWTP